MYAKDIAIRAGQSISIEISNRPYVDKTIPPESNDYRWADEASIEIYNTEDRLIAKSRMEKIYSRPGWYSYRLQTYEHWAKGVYRVVVKLKTYLGPCPPPSGCPDICPDEPCVPTSGCPEDIKCEPTSGCPEDSKWKKDEWFEGEKHRHFDDVKCDVPCTTASPITPCSSGHPSRDVMSDIKVTYFRLMDLH